MTPQEMEDRKRIISKLRALTEHHAPTVLDEKFYVASMPIADLRIILGLFDDVVKMSDEFLFGGRDESRRQTAFDILYIAGNFRRSTEEKEDRE